MRIAITSISIVNSLFLCFLLFISVNYYYYSTFLHIFSHCHQIYCKSQDDDESLSEKQIDIEPTSLDEITEAVASLVVLIKINPVVLNHSIAHDDGEQKKKQCHNEYNLFIFRESQNYIFHGVKVILFFSKRCPLPPCRCLLPTKKVST